jgi:hypothetical protein
MRARVLRSPRDARSPLGPLRLLPAAALVFAAGCAEDTATTALDLELTPDPNLNTVEQVVAAIETLVLVVDSPEGLYPPGSETVVGDVQIKNVDGDTDALELVTLIPMPDDRLPWIRLHRGGLPDVPLTIRLTGLERGGSTRAIALGRVEGVRFTEGELVSLVVPFDLGSEVRAPRVEEVLPPDGDDAPGCRIEEVTIVFSEAIDAASLAAPGAVEVEPGGPALDLRLSGSGYIATYQPTALAGAGGVLHYRVTVSTAVVDRDGNPLDQSPTEPGAQAYIGDFQLNCTTP